MQKDFDTWNTQKKSIDHSKRTILFHEREIWWCTLGVNVGSEQNGDNKFFERPVLILKKFSRDVLWVIPITKSVKLNPYYYQIDCLEFLSSVILSQIRLISSKRLRLRIKTISEIEFMEIVDKIKDILPSKH